MKTVTGIKIKKSDHNFVILVNTTDIFDNYPIHVIWYYSPNNGELQVPIRRGSTIEITKDGIYEVSVSFIFQSVGGKRIWGNLMRKHKDTKTQDIKGKIMDFSLYSLEYVLNAKRPHWKTDALSL